MKIIEFADAHIDPKWIDDIFPCFQLLAQTGKENKIKAFVFGADLFNRPLYATDKDKYGVVIQIAKMLLSVAPVVCVTGTKSHDGPGCYSILKELGFTVLRPEEPQVINGILFMGLPEVDKIAFMKTRKWTADQASMEIIKVINSIITDYFIPTREMHKDKPAVFVGHGVFIDGIKDNDIIARNTDIVIDNNILAKVGFTRVVLGHYHTPKESKILPGGYTGYMGFDNTPWSNTGFQPGFNLVNISYGTNLSKKDYMKFVATIKRIDYPVQRRDKVKTVFGKFIKQKNTKFSILPENTNLKIKLDITKEEFKKLNIEELKKNIIEDSRIIHEAVAIPIPIKAKM